MPYRPAYTVLVVLASCRAVSTAGVLSNRAVNVEDPWGDTVEYASSEAEANTVTCQRRGSPCLVTAPSLSDLVRPRNKCGETFPVLAWRTAREFKHADQYLAELRSRAASRELFGCTGYVCLVVLPTTASHETDNGVTTLSVCSVDVIGGMVGPPRSCEEAAKQKGTNVILLRSKAGTTQVGCSMGLRDFDLLFKGKAPDVPAVKDVVARVLRTTPFRLTVLADGNALVGIRAHLASEVLVGWREWVTVRVEIATRGDDAGATIYTTLLVSKQATANREAWTPPSEPQEATYLLALEKEFQRHGAVLSIRGVGE